MKEWPHITGAIFAMLSAIPAAAQPATVARDTVPPPAAALAPAREAPPIPGTGAGAAALGSRRLAAGEAVIDRRIRTLRQRLGITHAQLPLWSAVAHAMREDAQSTDLLLAQRAAAVGTMSAADNMNSYARIARIYADNAERLAAAFGRLYSSLTATQRRAADAIFREPAAPR